jgi:hypothetical protein
VKDAYYFSHDSNARNDRKTSALIISYGMAGYGMWWVLVEMLREEENYKLPMDELTYSAMAKDMLATPEQVEDFIKDCINRFMLLESDGEYFWSNSMLRRMKKLEETREKRRGAAEKRWNADAKQKEDMQCTSNANAEQMQCTEMQSKVKESKVKESINTAKPEPNGSKREDTSNLPAKQDSSLSPLKDNIANYWQELFIYHQPHTTWSNYGQERGQLSTLAKKTRAFLKTSPYVDEYEVAKNIFDMFLYMRQHSKDKRIRESPIIPSRVSMFWSDITTALAERYHSEEQAARYNDVEVPL